MRLRITTPLAVVVDEDGVLALRAEDATGSFGILPRHADFLTSLAISVVSWESGDGTRHYCAVRRGVLSVIGGQDIAIATREAVTGDDLATLDETVLARFRADIETERAERVESTRLQLNAIRQIVRHLRPAAAAARGISHDRAGERPGEQDPLVQGVRLRGERYQPLAARGRSLGGAPSCPDRRARLDHRRAHADRRVRRPLARPNVSIPDCSAPRRS